MSAFHGGLIIGLIVGANLGLILFSLMHINKRDDDDDWDATL